MTQPLLVLLRCKEKVYIVFLLLVVGIPAAMIPAAMSHIDTWKNLNEIADRLPLMLWQFKVTPTGTIEML